jgi:hypothetical protein
MEHLGDIDGTHHGAAATKQKPHAELNFLIAQLGDIVGSRHYVATFREKLQAQLHGLLAQLGVIIDPRHGAATFLQSAFRTTKAQAVAFDKKSQDDTHYGAAATIQKQQAELHFLIAQPGDIVCTHHGDATFREKLIGECNTVLPTGRTVTRGYDIWGTLFILDKGDSSSKVGLFINLPVSPTLDWPPSTASAANSSQQSARLQVSPRFTNNRQIHYFFCS